MEGMGGLRGGEVIRITAEGQGSCKSKEIRINVRTPGGNGREAKVKFWKEVKASDSRN